MSRLLLVLCALPIVAGCRNPRPSQPDISVPREGPPVVKKKPVKIPDLGAPAHDVRTHARCLYPPAALYIKFAELLAKGQHPAAFGRLGTLLRDYPDSALLRVRVASLLMRAAPAYPARAQKLYHEALKLEKNSVCVLSPRFRWLAINGMASAMMEIKDHAGALPWLRQAVTNWPHSAATRYNLACALCMVGQVDACFQELSATLAICESGKKPAVEKANESAYYYVKHSQIDADLARLRADKRYEALIRPYLIPQK